MKAAVIFFFLTLSFLTKSIAAGCSCANGGEGYGGINCGMRLGCDEKNLYICKNAMDKPKLLQKCPKGCAQSGQESDYCLGCTCYNKINKKKQNGNFVYCGDVFACAPNAAYSCSSDEVGIIQVCNGTCIKNGDGPYGDGKSYCSSCKCPDAGKYCGNDIGCPRKSIMECKAAGAVPITVKTCGYGCEIKKMYDKKGKFSGMGPDC